MSNPSRDRPEGLPVHPLLIGSASIISLIGHNIIEISPVEGLRALLVAVALVGVVWLLVRLVTRWSWARSGLLASLAAALFFGYGHFYSLVEGAAPFGVRFGRHLVLGPVWLGLLIAGAWGIYKLREPKTLTQALNLVGLALLVVPVYQIAAHELTLLASRDPQESARASSLPGEDAALPDIYYIISDAYARDDSLLEVFGYDNTPFLEALAARGFTIPRCTRSNYGRTYLSVSSSLNMNYVQHFAPHNGPGDLTAMIKDSAVRRRLEDEGYTVVAFDSSFFRTQWPDADHWYRSESRVGSLRTVTEFETLIIETTALLLVLDGNIALGGAPLNFMYETVKLARFNQVNFILDTLVTVPGIPGPKFVFVHIPSPHGPYVFSAEGDFTLAFDEQPEGYRNQVEYLNQRILPVIDTILAESRVPPIIILQGDHGASETKADFRRLNILNAYYLPGPGAEALYPEITPVNTFRLIFDTYLGDDYGLIPDVSYFSPIEKDYAFEVAPEAREGCAAPQDLTN